MRILVVDDDKTLRVTLRSMLEAMGHAVEEAEDGQAAVDKVTINPAFDAAVIDVSMPRMSGLEALAKIKESNPAIFCLIATAYSDVKDAVLAIKQGAYDYIQKPIEPEYLVRLLDAAREANSLVEAAAFSAPTLSFDDGRAMIGGSSSLQKVFDVIYKLSRVDTSVLIRGESGTGKELVARALHFNSHRKKGPFVAVNCAAIPENLIESELFGHEKGAFTGADRKKIGKFQAAEGGTIFLDEIGDMSPPMQVKLLRVLQERVINLVGTTQDVQIDVRVIAATNRPLEKMIEKDSFRADLFYRLNILPIILPPLRDRREDILPLVQYMVRKFNRIHGRSIKDVSREALNALRLYNWPGNIRELENVIERAFILESTANISIDALPEHIQVLVVGQEVAAEATEGSIANAVPTNLDSLLHSSDLNYPALKEKFEKEFIIKALKTFDGRINQTAEHTQMTKVTLLRKLEKYGIDPKEYHRH